MKFLKIKTSLSIVSFVAFATVSVFTQATRPDFNRPSTYDVQHYVIRASFDRTNKRVFGDTTISLKPLRDDFREVSLDAVDMAFESVRLEPGGIDLKYKTTPGKIVIALDKAYGPADIIAIRLKYTATPLKGVYFVAAESGTSSVNHSAQIWSQGEAEEARHWFPSFDFPSDKATTEEYITANKDETVVGNGEFLGKVETSEGKETWHYKMPVPHSTYLVSFVIGNYARVDDKYGDVPLGFYVYPGKENTARNAFGQTKNMIGVYESLTGVAFPYSKYDQTMVARFQFGGMENITATTFADTEIFFGDFEFGKGIVTDLVSHELSHSWFGDMVTCKNWAELWLNEGFATYMEAAYREKAVGRENYMDKIRSDAAEFLADDSITKKRHGLFNLRAGDVNALFDNAAVTYHKGGVVIHMLRETVGDTAFWKGVNVYLDRHKFANVESTDLKKAMEEASGQDLGWFFDQWVYAAGAPKLDVRQTYSRRTKTMKITIVQTQVADEIVPAAFRLPVDFGITTASGKTLERIDVTKRIQSFSIKTGAKPTSVALDEKEQIPLKRVKIRPLFTVN